MLEKVSLFRNKRDFFHFSLLILTLSFLSISLEYYKYKQLTKFDSQLVNATVLKQYTKTKLTKKGNLKSYQVLKFKSKDGFTFYSTASKQLTNIKYKKVKLEVWAGKISFKEYMRGFFCFSKILQIYPDTSYKTKLNTFIDKQHNNKNISLLYQALFTAKQLPYELQTLFSNLGVSHLIAISGFHLGVLSAVLFFLIKFPYKFLQNNYFPYRNNKRDTFIIVSLFLLSYLLFLEIPPSLLRAFVMLIIGFILYDRGIKVISIQTLLLTILLILALFPRLFFSIGFWLSVSGVFYIFLFLIHFKELSKVWQFLLMPLWVYLLMLPYSLLIFGNFSLYHPLSILWTSLFTLFYPSAILLHIFGVGNLMDGVLENLLSLQVKGVQVTFSKLWFIPIISFSLLSIFKRWSLLFLITTAVILLIKTVLLT
jgi:competence protein ComEC